MKRRTVWDITLIVMLVLSLAFNISQGRTGWVAFAGFLLGAALVWAIIHWTEASDE